MQSLFAKRLGCSTVTERIKMPKRGGELGCSKNLSNLQAPIQPLVPSVTRELLDKSFAT